MSISLLITQEQLVQESVLNDNVDFKSIRSLIVDVQDIHVQQLVGSRLYRKIMTDVENNNLTGSYQTLVEDYIRPYMVASIIADAPDYLWVKYMNKTIGVRSSTEVKALDDSQLIRVMNSWRDKAQFRGERVTRYLMENRTSFTEYDVPDTGLDAIEPNKTNYTQGLYLDDDDNVGRWGIPRVSDRDHNI